VLHLRDVLQLPPGCPEEEAGVGIDATSFGLAAAFLVLGRGFAATDLELGRFASSRRCPWRWFSSLVLIEPGGHHVHLAAHRIVN
jgi:hypothetical protein